MCYFVFSTGIIIERAFAVDLIASRIIHVTLFDHIVRIEHLKSGICIRGSRLGI